MMGAFGREEFEVIMAWFENGLALYRRGRKH